MNPTTTNSAGSYSFPDLTVGSYRIAVEKNGFRTAVSTHVVLNVADTRAVNLQLEAGQLDLQPLRLNSINLPEVKKVPGKAAAWQGIFVSAQRQGSRPYTYSVIEAPGNLHKGVFAGNEGGWRGPSGSVKPFPVQALKIDSDAAYETAVKKGKKAAEYIKAHPDMNIMFLLEQNNKFPDLTWRVIWGESVGTSNYSVFVDATTGEYLETMR